MAAKSRRKVLLRGAALLLFLAVSLIHVVYGGKERSGWISMTQPGGRDHDTNSQLGYSFLHGARPFMKENIPHVTQVGLFAGARDALTVSEFRENFRFLRALYSFLAALLTPPLDAIAAMLAVNWLSWALCVWSAWRLTRDVFHSEAAAAVAGALAAGGMGATAHIHDYSPHLLAFGTYFFGAWLLYRSDVWRPNRGDRRRSTTEREGAQESSAQLADAWSTHLRLGLYLAVANLAYSTGTMLAAAYLLVAFRWRRLLPVAAALALALAPRTILQKALGPRLEDVEADFLARGLESWRETLQGGVYLFVEGPLQWLSEFLFFFDSPLAVLVGLACLAFTPMPWGKRWFGLCIVGAPFLASLPFAPVATARGYLVYAGAVWIYACIGYHLARGWKGSRFAVRGATTAAATILLATHFAWSGAHLARNLGPIKTYFQGWDQGWTYFTPTVTMSLTGQEPTPVMFGGKATLAEAGAFAADAEHRFDAGQVSFGWAYVAGGFFFLWVGLWAFASVKTSRRRMAVAVGWTAIFVLHCAAAGRWFRELPAFFPVDRAIFLAPGERLRAEAAVSPEFARALQARVQQGDAVVVLGPYRKIEGLEVSFFSGEERLRVRPQFAGLLDVSDGEKLLEQLAAAPRGRIALELINRRSTPAELAGWQRSSLPLRSCICVRDDGAVRRPLVLPVLEVRAIDARGRLTLAGF